METPEDKENRLKQWQDRLRGNSGGETSPVKTPRTRNQTGIDQDEVRAALRLARQQNEEPASQRSSKTKEHDNDEGFEETQSLMSESPSQGTSSDLIDSGEYGSKGNRPVRTSSLESKCTVDSTSATSSIAEPPPKPKRAVEKPTSRLNGDKMQSLLQRYSRGTIDRSNSVRLQPDDSRKTSVIPRRAASLRKTDSQNSVMSKKSGPVERSNSRASLVSSRSSLNSATSTNTVKKMPLKTLGTQKTMPRSIPATPQRKSLLLQPPKPAVTIRRVPSGSTLANQRPPLKASGHAFMKPTTSSTTKTHVPTITPSGRLLAYRSTTLK